MNDVSRELEQVLQQLKAEGKQPSVALLKSRLSQPVPLPLIVSALARDKAGHNPLATPTEATTEPTLAERVSQLEQQVATLQAQLATLLSAQNTQ
ncbi:hypothetical protein [Plesiomonas shigelloides]|uniref:hypothetical protein n=1 Tax=Plesiomonas shigelloides TaxID=703 RepID=UPI0022469E05|nr:hypothetical protein [Plesiomonas shigelloides]MCX2496899.1 hypothetical protein [Plesiomonas shigelloides]